MVFFSFISIIKVKMKIKAKKTRVLNKFHLGTLIDAQVEKNQLTDCEFN